MIRLAWLALLLVVSGCAPLFSKIPAIEEPRLRIVAGVPFFAQQHQQDCGPAGLASLLAHRGVSAAPAVIANAAYDPRLGGTLLPELENFARAQGVKTRSGRGSPELLRQLIDAQRPVLIPIESGMFGLSRGHYLVVFGYSPAGYVVHNGVEERLFIPAPRLEARWQVMNRLYLYLD